MWENALLRQGWIWSCPGCGNKNCSEMISIPISEIREKLDEYDIPDHENCEYICRPENVTCEKCHSIFKALSEHELGS